MTSNYIRKWIGGGSFVRSSQKDASLKGFEALDLLYPFEINQ